MRQKHLRSKINEVVTKKAPANTALKVVVLLIGVVLIYTIVQHDVLFRTFVILFLLGTAFFLNKKINDLSVNTKELGSSPVQEEMDDHHTLIFEKTVTEKEEQLVKIDLDRTQMLEELFSKAELDEREKQTYRERIRQKESERSYIMQDLMVVKGKLQQAVLETKNYFLKADPVKELAATLDAENIEQGSIATLNKRVQVIISSTLSEKTVEALLKGNYVDEEHNLTRSGYKALLKLRQKD